MKTKMNNNDLMRWGKSLLIAFAIFLILSFYLFLRRGYYDLYIINKVFASTAVIIAAITLIIGPLRANLFFANLMSIRRHLGLLAFGFALSHITASLYQSDRFVWFAWYINEWIPATFGIFAILIWIYMTYISRDKKIQEMGSDAWKNRLSIAGKIGFIAIFIHLTVMKYEGWIRWFTGQVKQTPELANPGYPPASLIIFIIMLVVIVYRIIKIVRKN